MNVDHLVEQAVARWPDQVTASPGDDGPGPLRVLRCPPERLPDLCGWLFTEGDCAFGGLVVEEIEPEWVLRYLFHGRAERGFVQVLATLPVAEREIPTISDRVHAADWHEREAEDLFGVVFRGHPRLGDFVLHDDVWQEGLEPMRHGFDGRARHLERQPRPDWRPRRLVQAEGAFVLPVGPVFAAEAEAVQFYLETVGEDVVRAYPRLFYKYRGIEKNAEGREVSGALLLAERFAATTAFAHAVAFSRAAEAIAGTDVPPRARTLRLLLAELERLRHHAGAIAAICASTGLVVPASEAAILEEELLRLCGALTGHRYLFGLAVPGGLARDLPDGACRDAAATAGDIVGRLERLEHRLRLSSSFLDRLEQVGFIFPRDAREHGLVGPLGRASGVAWDLRVAQPYGRYEQLAPGVPVEEEGDGYARLRVLFAETRQSLALVRQVVDGLGTGTVRAAFTAREGAALGWVEAPRGAAFHWLRLDAGGKVARYRIVPPSFTNWHGFYLAVERFAFQDLPIILATLDLSVAENDR